MYLIFARHHSVELCVSVLKCKGARGIGTVAPRLTSRRRDMFTKRTAHDPLAG